MSRTLAPLVVAALLLGGCGKKAPPQPPIRAPRPAAAATPVATPSPAATPPGVPGQQIPQ